MTRLKRIAAAVNSLFIAQNENASSVYDQHTPIQVQHNLTTSLKAEYNALFALKHTYIDLFYDLYTYNHWHFNKKEKLEIFLRTDLLAPMYIASLYKNALTKRNVFNYEFGKQDLFVSPYVFFRTNVNGVSLPAVCFTDDKRLTVYIDLKRLHEEDLEHYHATKYPDVALRKQSFPKRMKRY